MAHFQPFRDAVFEANRKAGRRDSSEAMDFDALMAMAQTAHTNLTGTAASLPGEATGAGQRGGRLRRPHRPPPPRHRPGLHRRPRGRPGVRGAGDPRRRLPGRRRHAGHRGRQDQTTRPPRPPRTARRPAHPRPVPLHHPRLHQLGPPRDGPHHPLRPRRRDQLREPRPPLRHLPQTEDPTTTASSTTPDRGPRKFRKISVDLSIPVEAVRVEGEGRTGRPRNQGAFR